MAKHEGFGKDALEGGAGIVVASGVTQLVMSRSGTDWPKAARNGAIVSALFGVAGALVAALAPRAPGAQRLGYGVGASGLSSLTSIGTQVTEYHLQNRAAQAVQERQAAVQDVVAPQPPALQAAPALAASAPYGPDTEDGGFASAI